MEFYGTARASEIGAIQVPWNSIFLCYLMEPFVSLILLRVLKSFKFEKNSIEFEFPNFDENYIQFCRFD